MKKDYFKNVMTDLYKAYCPEHLVYVDDLVEKYSRMEYSAIDMIFTKYNHKSKPYFDPVKNTDGYKMAIMKDYSEGNRPLENFYETIKLETPKEDTRAADLQEKIKSDIDGKTEELKKVGAEIDSQLSSKLQSADEILTDKEKRIEELYKKLEAFEKSIIEKNNQQAYSNVEIRITSNYTASELVLPRKEILSGLGVGARVLVMDKTGKIIGLEIKDIIYDTVSGKGDKTIIEITLDK